MPTPVVVLAGFLGAGKTTVLNHLLHNDQGVRIGVLVNDFGAVNIDAMAVAGQVDSTVSLGNGCLCCAVDSSDVDEMLAQLTAADLDLVVVEASGLAEPEPMMRMVAASELETVRYGGLVEVVDAVEFASTRRQHPQLDRHVAIADLVLLTKMDRAVEASKTREMIESITAAAVVPVEHGRVAAQLFVDPPRRRDDEPVQLSFDALNEHTSHVHADYVSASLDTGRALDPAALMDFLTDPPRGVFRVKGYVHFAIEGFTDRFEVHKVGRHVRFVRSAWPDRPRSTLVAIGAHVEESVLNTVLHGCVGEDIEPDSIYRVLRHTAQN